MPRIRILCLFLLFILASCSAPRVITPTPPPVVLPPTPTPLVASTRVVTLARATPTPATPTPTAVVTLPGGAVLVTISGEQSVNLRGGPGSVYPIVTRVANGSKWPAVARSEMGEWLLLESEAFPGGQGWIFVGLTDYNPDLQPLPAATAVQPSPTPQP